MVPEADYRVGSVMVSSYRKLWYVGPSGYERAAGIERRRDTYDISIASSGHTAVKDHMKSISVWTHLRDKSSAS